MSHECITHHNACDCQEAEHHYQIERRDRAIAMAYGFLWHVNSEPGTPQQYPPEKMAYEARKILRGLMTHEQRGRAIAKVRELWNNHTKEVLP